MDSEEWIFFIGTPLYEKVDLTTLYGQVREALEALPKPTIDQHQIRLLNPKKPPVVSMPKEEPFPITRSPDEPYWVAASSSTSSATGSTGADMLVYPRKSRWSQ